MALHVLFLSVFAINVGFSFGQSNSLFSSIDSLTTDSTKTKYLEEVFYDDQYVRNEWALAMQLDSAIVTRAMNRVRLTDSLNLLKVSYYLGLYGYPSRSRLSELAVATPLIVIHHATLNQARVEHFPLIQRAYRANDVGEELFRMYMARTLSIQNAKPNKLYYNYHIDRLQRLMERLFKQK